VTVWWGKVESWVIQLLGIGGEESPLGRIKRKGLYSYTRASRIGATKAFAKHTERKVTGEVNVNREEEGKGGHLLEEKKKFEIAVEEARA